MIKPHYAHSLPNRLPEAWEPLRQHLRLVAEGGSGLSGAAEFAAAFGAEDWGRILGWWHDVGKYSTEFQHRLRAANGFDAALETLSRVDHSTAGARHASAKAPGAIGRILAYCIAGHHGGLPDFCSEDGGAELRRRLSPDYAIPSWDAAPDDVLNIPPPDRVPLRHPARSRQDGLFQLATFCRMLFSCLVDADFLATEQFMRPDSAAARPARAPTMVDLEGALTQHLNKFTSLADETQTASSVNQLRAAVLAACREKALLSPGLFSLTVPTGGGKTLSSLAFALRHAVSHGLRRVIYAIPYTSIIEQNAGIFRKALSAAGDDVVLEHHSNFDPENEKSPTGRLAAENWDAPVIVTTNVQFFESLFANKPSRCRKLHRIARSVIILDECQTLPATLLRPTLAMLQELARHYGCTIVLCSATMPAVTRREDFAIGLEGVREIIDDSPGLFAALKRVEVQRAGPLKDDELAGRLAELPQVLCVVNTKATAASLYRAVAARVDQGVFHLSAAMCPAHRESVLKRVKTALRARESCRVISTQVIEAGVDVDFPVVYRALAGLDSIAQAAGRCNREGRLPIGRVVVLDPEQGTPSLFRAAADAATEVAGLYGDWLSLDAIAHYFRLVYWQRTADWDKHGTMRLASIGTDGLDIRFRSIAEAYRLIADDQVPVLIRYDETAERLIDEVERSNEPPDQRMRRRLQRYTVNVQTPVALRMIADQVLVEVHPGVNVLKGGRNYDRQTGIVLGTFGPDPEDLVC